MSAFSNVNPSQDGIELDFLPSNQWEFIHHTATCEDKAFIISRNALRLLFMGWNAQWKQLLNWRVFKALIIEYDSSLVQALKISFQEGLEYVFTQLKGRALSAKQSAQVQLYLSNCLCIIPYTNPKYAEIINIPQYINEQWQLIEYTCYPIELTASWQTNKYLFNHNDRVFAYAFEPNGSYDAQPHLIFMGTTYPAAQGFVTHMQTNFECFKTVGHSLYLSGRARIIEWLHKQSQKVHVCGVSLGGSLSLLLALDQGYYLSRVDALNPAGLAKSSLHSALDKWDELALKPQVIIQQQAQDPVSFFGLWKPDWHLIHVLAPADKKGPNPLCDHVLNYAGFAHTQYIALLPEQENKKRKYRNFWCYGVGRSIVRYGLILPYVYLRRPITHWCRTYYIFMVSALIIALSIKALLLKPLGSALFMIGTLFIALFSLLGTKYLFNRCVSRSKPA